MLWTRPYLPSQLPRARLLPSTGPLTTMDRPIATWTQGGTQRSLEPPLSSPGASSSRSKTIVVLGASYGGARAARLLADSLPDGWRLIVIDRNSHFNHVYVFPRYTILSKHAAKGFIPYTYLFGPPPKSDPSSPVILSPSPTTPKKSRFPQFRPFTPPMTPRSSFDSDDWDDSDGPKHLFIQGAITALHSHSVSFVPPDVSTTRRGSLSMSLSRRGSTDSLSSINTTNIYGCFDGQEETIEFAYCIYALGSGMPNPVNVWNEFPIAPMRNVIRACNYEHGLGTKKGGMRWMERKAIQLSKAQRVLIVGGGALGIQYACDLKELYPDKEITLLHSRTRLMPIYPIEVHVNILQRLQDLEVNVVLGERVVTWPSDPEDLDGSVKLLTTDKGREFTADLVLPCTGQKPHSEILAALSPSSISPITSRIRVAPTMQLAPKPLRPLTSRTNTLDRLSSITLRPPSPPSSGSSADSAGGPVAERDYAEVFEDEDMSHIFAIGDCAETGAIQAGHTAYWQGEVAARNVLRLIERDDAGAGDAELEEYKAGVPAIKVTLGMHHDITANADGVKMSDTGIEDLQARLIWTSQNAAELPDEA